MCLAISQKKNTFWFSEEASKLLLLLLLFIVFFFRLGGPQSRWRESLVCYRSTQYSAGGCLDFTALLYWVRDIQSISGTVTCIQIKEVVDQFQILRRGRIRKYEYAGKKRKISRNDDKTVTSTVTDVLLPFSRVEITWKYNFPCYIWQPTQSKNVLNGHSKRRDSSHNERFYEEHDYERRVKKRRARLITATEEAFMHVKRINHDPGTRVIMFSVTCRLFFLVFSLSTSTLRLS